MSIMEYIIAFLIKLPIFRTKLKNEPDGRLIQHLLLYHYRNLPINSYPCSWSHLLCCSFRILTFSIVFSIHTDFSSINSCISLSETNIGAQTITRKSFLTSMARDCRLLFIISIFIVSSQSASSESASIKKLTGRKPSLQEIIADFLFFIHPS